MTVILKTAAGIIIALVLWLYVSNQEKDLALLLTLAVCVMVGILTIKELKPLFLFFRELEKLSALQEGILDKLLRICGISMATEMTAMLCADAGNGSMEKAVRLFGTVVMLITALPMLEGLVSVLREILSGI